jgi:Uma2 family endonuclease
MERALGTPQRRSLTEREYLDREAQAAERHEYVDGIVYAMAGAGERHNRIAGNVFVTLRLAARATPCGVYVSDMKLRVAHAAAYYYPDVMAASRRRRVSVQRRPASSRGALALDRGHRHS